MSTSKFSASEPWPGDVQLFQPFEVEQVLLLDNANILAVQSFLNMANLEYTIEMRANAEHMSPSGKISLSISQAKPLFFLLSNFPGRLPFIRANKFVIAEMDPIVAFVNTKVSCLNIIFSKILLLLPYFVHFNSKFKSRKSIQNWNIVQISCLDIVWILV